jgi:cell wall-associated NlpC family hydrolase
VFDSSGSIGGAAAAGSIARGSGGTGTTTGGDAGASGDITDTYHACLRILLVHVGAQRGWAQPAVRHWQGPINACTGRELHQEHAGAGVFELADGVGATPADDPVAAVEAPGAATAVAFIESQIGKPYCFAGAGPSCFDCSGLTMRAWQAGGLALPHFSGAQYAMFPAVPMTQLRPGDLVFPADPSQHVAMYIGNGFIVHATHAGDFVRAEPLTEPGLGLVFAVRPG